ncbi:MAG: hypothetical protein ACR2GY_01665 [Phycisphaerales bacterium]
MISLNPSNDVEVTQQAIWSPVNTLDMRSLRCGRIAASRKSRGDWHSFEPIATMVERYVDAFTASMPPYVRELADIVRKSA